MALRLFLLLLLLLAATLLISQAQGMGSSASDCCLNHSQKEIPPHVVTSYRLQGPDSGCFLRAVVFTTKRNKKICASPSSDAVQKLMQDLDKKTKDDKRKAQTLRRRGKPKKQRQQRV